MSIDSQIWIDTENTIEHVQRTLAQTTRLIIADDFEGIKQMRAEATDVTLLPALPDDTRTAYAGIKAKFQIGVHSTDMQSREWLVNAVRLAVALLHAYRGDLLFIYIERPVLMRRNGQVVLEIHTDFWSPHVEPKVLSLVDLPYEWGSIPMA